MIAVDVVGEEILNAFKEVCYLLLVLTRLMYYIKEDGQIVVGVNGFSS